MRKRRQQSIFVRAADAVGAVTLEVWSKISRRPVDTVAVVTAIVVTLIIVVNAIFLQSSMRAAPLSNAAKAASVKSDSLKPLTTGATTHPVVAAAVPQPVADKHNDAIAELIGPSPRIAAVQRALSEYGYGQIKVSGVLDDATGAAIEKFEHDHNMPSTGRVSDRLMKELAALVGHPID